MTINNKATAGVATAVAKVTVLANANWGFPAKHLLRTSLLVSALGLASLASAQGISGIGAFVPNTELGFTPVAKAGEPRINWINGEYQESNTDLSVKVLGGSLDIARSWSQGRWWLNPAWAPLSFELDPLGSDAKVIERVGVLYERSGQSDLYMAKSKGNAPVYIKRIKDAAGQHTGWQWYDRFGNTISYSPDGVIQSYANASGVKVSFAYDSATSARILDHGGKTIYTVTMAGGLITRIEDLAGRSVSYQWVGNNLSQVTDVMGHAWKYDYDANGQITSRTDPLGLKISAQYIQSTKAPEPMLSLGKKGVTIDPTGTSGTTQKLANLWGGGRVGQFDGQSGCASTGANNYLRERRVFEVTYTDCRGNATVTQYDLQGNELSRTFNDKKTASNQWDGAYSQKYTNARGYSTTTTYDSNYQPLQITHPDGSVEKYTYEPVFGRQSSYTNQLGVVSTWRYDSKGNVIELVEAKGLPEQRTTVYTYDQYSQLTSSTKGAGDATKADAITQSWQYDSAGSVIRATDAAGHSTKASYDSRGLPSIQIDALNRSTQLSWNAAGLLLQATNALGHTVQRQYDARGRIIQTTSPAGRTQRTRYNSQGRAMETIAPGQNDGAGTRIEYDPSGQPLKTITPGGLVIQTSYDSQGRTASTTDPAGNVTSYEYGQDGTPQAGLLIATQYPTYREIYQYDQRGRQYITTQQLANGQARTQRETYDPLGQRVASTDPAGRTTSYSYDALGRLTLTIDSLGNSTKQVWDAFDQLVSLTDANGNTHRFEYDKAGQPIKETRPMGGIIEYSYDATGQLIKRTDAAGNTRRYTYNDAGHLAKEEHRNAVATTDQSIGYQYDADGQMSSYEQKDGVGALISAASYTRDAQGRNTQNAVTYGKVDGGTFSFTLGQGYNADGQIQSNTYPDGNTQTYVYDKGRLSQVTLPNKSQISYQQYQWMQPTRIVTPGATKTQNFDALQRFTGIEVQNASSQILTRRQYQYDIEGNITQIESDLGKTTYGYDILNRLTQVNPDRGLQNLGLPSEQYSYDPVGNRTSSQHHPGEWKYNGDNQLVQYPRADVSSAAEMETMQVSYTPQGYTEQETAGVWKRDYRYNAAERLIEVNQNGETTSYRYDPFGRRIFKSGSNGTTYFLNGEFALMAEVDDQGRMSIAYGFNPKTAHKKLWSSEPIWQAQVADNSLMDASTQYHYMHTDHLGVPVITTTLKGQPSWQGISEAFGATIAITDAIDMNLRFPGQYLDKETQSHQNFHRDYRPDLGRYLQSDPLGVLAGANLFLYAEARPLWVSDSYGLITLPSAGDLSDIDYQLLLRYLSRKGGYMDLSKYCNRYTKTRAISQRLDELENAVDNLTASYAGALSDGQVVEDYIGKRNTNTVGDFAYAAGVGVFHTQAAKCKITGVGCNCAESDCEFNVSYIDEYKDVIDLCQKHGVCGSAQDVFGDPFVFGLNCKVGGYFAKKCK